MNKYISKLSFFLFVGILFCGILFSCEKDNNVIDDSDVFDLSEKGKVANKTVSLDLDGTELIMDSCRMDYTCLSGYVLTSYQKNTKNKLVIRWYLDDYDVKVGTFKVYNEGHLNGLNILLDDHKPNGKIAIHKFEIKEGIDCDSIFIEGIFHTKIYENNTVKNVKGQFSYKGLIFHVLCL